MEEKSCLSVSQANRMDVEETLQTLNTTKEGLSTHEARRRLPIYGFNILEKVDDESMILKFLGQFKEPLILLLLGSALVSIIMGEIADALGIFIAVTIVNLVGFYQEYKSEKSVEALRSLTAHYCSVVRDGTVQTISSQDIVPGDMIPLESGCRIPADLRLCESSDLHVG
jgi:P-type Ca2+ transporter type 2C